MIPLPNTYKKYGYEFKLLERKGDVAIFEQLSEGKVIAYEVFEVLKNEEATVNFAGTPVTYPAKEAIPSTEQWGTNAFTCTNLSRAYEKMKYLLERISNRQVKEVDAKIQVFATHAAQG